MKKIAKSEDDLQYFSGLRRDMVQFVPSGIQTMLEIGCGVGEFSRVIQQQFDAEVWGIEPNAEAAVLAAAVLKKVLNGTIEANIDNLPDAFFDCICMNDVIEHLVDPWTVLQQLKAKLTPNGVLVASIPNVRHYKNLENLLLRGDWRYTDAGLLDRTHLRFFTPKSMQRFFSECGYRMTRFGGIRQSRKFKLRVLCWLSFGRLWDIAYLQFAIVARPSNHVPPQDE